MTLFGGGGKSTGKTERNLPKQEHREKAPLNKRQSCDDNQARSLGVEASEFKALLWLPCPARYED